MAITFVKVKVANMANPRRSRSYEFLTFKKAVGNALFEFQGKVRAAPVIFGDNGIFLLGATTLEALGLILDPIRRQTAPHAVDAIEPIIGTCRPCLELC